MKKTPKECIEKWSGKQLRIQEGETGCCLVIIKPVIGSGLTPKHPHAKPIVKMPEQREILVALVQKAGGDLII